MPYRTINEDKREREKPSKSGSKSTEQLSIQPEGSSSSKKKAGGDKSDKADAAEQKGKEKEKGEGGQASAAEESGSSGHGTIEEIEELLDVDGELKGCTPFTCDVIPRALRVIL